MSFAASTLCDLGSHDCHSKADCTPLPGGFRCDCRQDEGYYGNGTWCYDYCKDHPCPVNSKCFVHIDTRSPECRCVDGYRQQDEGCIREVDASQDKETCKSMRFGIYVFFFIYTQRGLL